MVELAATLPKYPGAFYGTGSPRDYSKEAYVGYEKSGKIWFPVKFRTMGYHMKERVIGLKIKGQFKAYPLPNSQRVQVKSRIQWAERSCSSALMLITKLALFSMKPEKS